MVKRPTDMNAFEFAVVSGLRAAQLTRGCTPRVDQCEKVVVTAQHEVAEGKVLRTPAAIDALSDSSD
jgi:DNA-directed RNA polymerase subunit K/omega